MQPQPPEIPTGLNLVRVVFERANVSWTHGGGPNSTCYECPFATVPLRSDGSVAAWHEIDNDPTEAYFRCFLPGRDSDVVAWGEYAPCEQDEWLGAGRAALEEAVARIAAIGGWARDFSMIGYHGVKDIRELVQRVVGDWPTKERV